MKFKLKIASGFIVGIGFSLVVGCGGSSSSSGGGGSDSTLVKINEDNAEELAALVLDLSSFVSSSGVGDLATFSAGNNAGSSRNRSVMDFALTTVQSASNNRRITVGGLQTRAIAEDTINCVGGGTMFISVNDKDNSQSLSSGDSFEIVATQCIDDEGDLTNGTISAVFSQFSASSITATFNMDTDLTVDGEVGHIAGDFTLNEQVTADRDTSVFSSNKLSMTIGGENAVLENITFTVIDDANGFSEDYDGTVSSNVIGGKVSFETDPVFRGGLSAFYPDTGVMTVSGADGSSVIIDADTGVNSTLNLIVNNGSSTTSEVISWSELESN